MSNSCVKERRFMCEYEYHEMLDRRKIAQWRYIPIPTLSGENPSGGEHI